MSDITWDRALLARIQARDRGAERLFYDAHIETIYQMALRMTYDADLAQDLTQETFLRAFDKAGQYRGDGPARGWLRRIARSVILNGLAQQHLHQQREPLLDEGGLPEEILAAPTTEPVTFELREQLEQALMQLPEGYRRAVTLYYMDGLTHKELARKLGITVQLSKVWLCRARARLRMLLAEYAQDWLVEFRIAQTATHASRQDRRGGRERCQGRTKPSTQSRVPTDAGVVK